MFTVDRMEAKRRWSDLAMPAPQLSLLRAISDEAHVQTRRRQGTSALFSGPAGAGKTLAAQVLASTLGRDLYRVDLSRTVSKYIGETEKNLSRLFAAAGSAGAILLFDEADALFGKRSEVKDSHDRYANIEVSYLLQRLESFGGLAILTTARKADIDPAFLRRLRYVVDFPRPGPVEQRLIRERSLVPHP